MPKPKGYVPTEAEREYFEMLDRQNLCQRCNLALGHIERFLSNAFVYLGGDDVSRN